MNLHHEIKRWLLLGRKVMTNIDSILKSRAMRKVKDGGGIGWGDHFLPHIFIERSTEHWANSTKQLLNTGRRHQAPRKAAHCIQKEVGQKIKRETKQLGMETHPGEGVMKKFPNTRKPSHRQFCGELWNLRGQHNQEGKKKQTHRMCT